jgi:hypothetical protein
MKLRPSVISVGIVFLLLTACSAHSPMILTNTTDSAAPDTTDASTDKVFVTKQSLPPGLAFETISRIDVGTIWYYSNDKVLVLMADRARELRANALVEVKTWRQPSGFAWAAPNGSAIAVRVKDIKAIESSGVQGSWY